MIPRILNIAVKKWKSLKRHVERAIVGALVVDKKSHTLAEPHNIHYKNLQRCYLIAFYLATLADFMQGPYFYQVYKDYGYSYDLIVILYVTGFASSCIFGTLLGLLADRYGRKILCSIYTVLYIISCVTKASPSFFVQLIGRVLGGVATSILFTTFEAWYVNEHINFYKLPSEWLNTTFSRATYFSGVSAMLAGVLAQFSAEFLNFGSLAPSLFAIPFLVLCFLVIQSTWKEHIALVKPQRSLFKDIFYPLKLLREDENLLLCLGFVQSVYESVMYTFIFSWTPILADLKPPLGIVFSLFMLACIAGSKTYSWLVSRRYGPQNILVAAIVVANVAFLIITLSLNTIVSHVQEHDPATNKAMGIICFTMFLIFEWTVGIYFPATGYLRSRTVPEEFRATLSNWFRVPMNILTCISLTLKHGSDSSDVSGLQKFQFVYIIATVLLTGAVSVSVLFSKRFSKKIIHDELAELKTGKVVSSETV